MAPAFGRVLDDRKLWPKDLLRHRGNMFSYGACADKYADLFRSLV